MNIETYLSQILPVEPFLQKVFDKDEPLVIFDIGACEGEESIRYSRMFPNCNIHAFEPLISNFEKAVNNLKLFNSEKVKLNNKAVSDVNGKLNFFVSSGHPAGLENTKDWNYGNKSSSLLEPEKKPGTIHGWLKFEDQQLVEAITLKSYMQEKNLSHIDFIHMDVQGAELKVMKGLADEISKVNLVWLEVAKVSMYKGQPLVDDMDRFMKKNGFRLVAKNHEGNAGDHLYIHSDFFEARKNRFSLMEKIKIYLRNL